MITEVELPNIKLCQVLFLSLFMWLLLYKHNLLNCFIFSVNLFNNVCTCTGLIIRKLLHPENTLEVSYHICVTQDCHNVELLS